MRSWAWRGVGAASLRTKIMGIALAMISLLGLGLTLQARHTISHALQWEMQQRATSIAHHLALTSAEMILTNDVYGLYESVADAVHSNEDVRYAFILDARGDLIAHSFEGGFPGDLFAANSVPTGEEHSLEMLRTEDEVIMDVAHPILGGLAGVTRVGLSRSRLDRSLAEVTWRFLSATALVSLLAVAISTGLTVLLTRPVLALADATRRVARGDLSHRLRPWADDEIGQLQTSFNAMVESLERSRLEMEVRNNVSHAVAGRSRLEDVLRLCLNEVMRLVQADGGWICMLGEGAGCGSYVSAIPGWQPGGCDPGAGRCAHCEQAIAGGMPVVVDGCSRRCAGSRGRPAGHEACRHVVVPLPVRGQPAGLLYLTCAGGSPCDDEEMAMLKAISGELGVAIENAGLLAELREKEAMRGDLLRRLIGAQEEERKRLARELHDESGQALTSLLLGIRLVENSTTLEQAREIASGMRGTVSQTLEEVHNMALELRPSALDDLGLVAALRRYAQSSPTRLGIEVDLVTAGMDGQRLPLAVETALYRIAQEALTNVARHSGAGGASVLLERRGDSVVLMVEDEGAGFDLAAVTSARRRRLGLYGMEERASLVGGRLLVESAASAGTTVRVEVPLKEDAT